MGWAHPPRSGCGQPCLGSVLAAPSESCVGVAHRAEPGAWAVPSHPSAVQGNRVYTGGKAAGAWPWAGGPLRPGRGGWTRCSDPRPSLCGPVTQAAWARGGDSVQMGFPEDAACGHRGSRPPGPTLGGDGVLTPASPRPWCSNPPRRPLSPPHRLLTPALRTTATSPRGFLVCCHPHGSATSLHVRCQRGPMYPAKLVHQRAPQLTLINHSF